MARRKKEDIIINEKPTGFVEGAMPKPVSALPTAPDPKPTPKADQKKINEAVEELLKPIEKPVKAEKKKTEGYFDIPEYTGYSFLEALRILKYDSSFAARKEIAKANGIENYLGLGKDNKEMLDLLMDGKLKLPVK